MNIYLNLKESCPKDWGIYTDRRWRQFQENENKKFKKRFPINQY